MAFVTANGIRLSYQRTGHGDPVVLIMGSAAGGRLWTMHQTPALNRAGYETVTFDNRGIAPSDAPTGRYRVDDMIADTIGLIEALGVGPAALVGTSLGASIAQELALARPDLVRCAVLLGTRARADAIGRAHTLAGRALAESGVKLPAAYHAATSVIQMLGPATLDDDAKARTWLDLFELSGDAGGGGQAWADSLDDRRAALGGITAPCRVIAFADDLITSPKLCAETAAAIPDCDYVEIAGCGHLGYLERPDEVNAAILEFLAAH